MTAADVQPLIDWLNENPDWVLLSIFAIAFVESLALAGIIVPGVLLLFLVAALAGSLDFPLFQALLAGFLGAVAGDGISFYLGHFFRDSLRTRWPISRYPKAMAQGEAFFRKHGGKSVVIGRFVGPIRPVIPIVAGMLGMSQWRFLSFNILSAIAWSPFYLLPGYLTGAAAQIALPDHFYSVLIGLVSGLVVIVLLFRYVHIHLQKGSSWYDSLEIYKSNSRWFRRCWIFLTRYHEPPREFPLASITLGLGMIVFFLAWTSISLSFGALHAVDQFLLDFALTLRSEWLDRVLLGLTMLGDEAFLYLSFGLLIAVFLLRGAKTEAAFLAAGGLATAIITHGLKNLFAIARPEWVTASIESFAYPSGHSSGTTVFFGLAASFIAQNQAHRVRWQIYTAMAIPFVLIALSRVFLGVHWFSDIIGGISLGLAICAATRTFYSRYTRRQLFNLERRAYDWLIVLTLWIGAAACYIYVRYDYALALYAL